MNKNKVFTFLVVAYPILNRYAAPIPYFTLSDFLMLICAVYILIKQKGIIRPIKIMFPVLGYFIFSLFLLITFMNNDIHFNDSFGSMLRLIYIYTIIFAFHRTSFDFESGVKYIKYCGLFVSIYLFIQYIGNLFGIFISTYIPFLPILGNNIDTLVRQKASYGLMFRGSSLFNEPASLCIYLFVALLVELFYARKKVTTSAVIYSIAIVLSFSSTGLIILALIYCCYYIQAFKGSRKQLINTIILGIAAVAFVIFISIRLNVFDFFVNKVFSGTNSVQGLMTNSRFYALARVFSSDRDFFRIMFGSGLYSMDGSYLPGFFRAYYCLGFMGAVSILCFFWKMKNNHTIFLPVIVLIVFTVLNIGTEILFGEFSVLYLAFIFSDTCDSYLNHNEIQINI